MKKYGLTQNPSTKLVSAYCSETNMWYVFSGIMSVGHTLSKAFTLKIKLNSGT